MMAATLAAPKVGNRWLVAWAGVLVQMLLGTVYAWSVFKKPFVEAHGWSNTQVGAAFTLVILFIGLAAAFGGAFVDKAGARRVATLAGLLFGIGTVLAGLADLLDSLWLLWLGFGVIGGIGNGLGYVTPIAVLVRWFPDKRGLITGMAVMGFGLGAAIMGQVAPLIIPAVGLANTFFIFGGAFLVLLLAAGQQLNNPPVDWQPPVAASGRRRQPEIEKPCDLATALRMNQFYLLWGILCLNVTAGIALLSNLSPMAQAQTGLTAVGAGTVVLLGSLANGFGRIFWASLSEHIGRRLTFLLLLGTQIPLLLLLPSLTSPATFSIVCCYILLCYGGGFATMPAFVADTFGAKCMGQIYGKILLAWSAAGVLGPMLMEYVHRRSGDFVSALQIAAALLAVGFLLALAYRRPTSPGQSPA